ncbi:MAG: T9SS type A sorting domain-containing protein, partial [Bacteroidetes bacterium]|nr:T9SS type A sorting domain-containing protein [Bacteroidota bacterium]
AGDQSFLMIGSTTDPYAYATNNGPHENPSGITSRLQREWLVQKRNFTNTDITLEFNLGAISAGFASGTFNASDLRLLVDNDGDFTDASIISSPTASINVAGSVVSVTVPASSFGATSYITLASAASTSSLPVAVSGFTAVCKNNKVQVSWTKQSTASSTYYIERSADGHSFSSIATVNSASAGGQLLNWTDVSPLPGMSYYRLVVVDENNLVSYTPVAGVNGCSIESLRLVSDAVSGQSLALQLQQSATVNIALYDVLGHALAVRGLTGQHALVAGQYRMPVQAETLVQGVYLLSVNINGNTKTFRIIQP